MTAVPRWAYPGCVAGAAVVVVACSGAQPLMSGTGVFMLAALAGMLWAPREPALGLWIYLVLAHAIPRYSSPFTLILNSRILEAVALLAFLAAMLRPESRSRMAGRLRGPLFFIGVFVLWLGVCLLAAWWEYGLAGISVYRRPVRYLDAAVLAGVASVTMVNGVGFARTALAFGAALCARAVLFPLALHRDNDIAGLIAIAVPLLAGACLMRGPWPRRTGALALLVCLAVALFFTENRAGALGLTMAALTLALTVRRSYMWLPLVVIAFWGFGVWFSTTAYWDRFAVLFREDALGWATEERLDIWRVGWELARQHPLFGVGPGRFPIEAGRAAAGLGQSAAHNNFLSVLVESGWLGVILYCAIFAWTLGATWRFGVAKRDSWQSAAGRSTAAALVAYLVVGLFLTRQDLAIAYVLAGAVSGWLNSPGAPANELTPLEGSPGAGA